jgi:hypothetical protein
MAWAFESKAVNYDVEDRVQENKSGSWTYKGPQGLLYSSFFLSSSLSIEKVMTVIRSGGTSVWYGVVV